MKNNTGDYNSGDYNSGDGNSGDYNSGDVNSGNYNSGYYNIGNYNSGDFNSGEYNSGYYNSGEYNSGYYNTGNYNSGEYNSGDCNSGDGNSGDVNSGDYNTGDYNTGNYNSGDYNNGYFNTNEPKLRMFNKETDVIRDKIIFPNYFYFNLTEWIGTEYMTEYEKGANPDYEVTGGYLKTYKYKGAWKKSFEEKCDEKQALQTINLPNFDYDIFEEITGITRKMLDEKAGFIKKVEENVDNKLLDAKQTLKHFSTLEINIQNANKEKILQAFKTFWESNPTEDEFDEYTNGLVLTPKILYNMIKKFYIM
jgi:hypothetical protein